MDTILKILNANNTIKLKITTIIFLMALFYTNNLYDIYSNFLSIELFNVFLYSPLINVIFFTILILIFIYILLAIFYYLDLKKYEYKIQQDIIAEEQEISNLEVHIISSTDEQISRNDKEINELLEKMQQSINNEKEFEIHKGFFTQLMEINEKASELKASYLKTLDIRKNILLENKKMNREKVLKKLRKIIENGLSISIYIILNFIILEVYMGKYFNKILVEIIAILPSLYVITIFLRERKNIHELLELLEN